MGQILVIDDVLDVQFVDERELGLTEFTVSDRFREELARQRNGLVKGCIRQLVVKHLSIEVLSVNTF